MAWWRSGCVRPAQRGNLSCRSDCQCAMCSSSMAHASSGAAPGRSRSGAASAIRPCASMRETRACQGSSGAPSRWGSASSGQAGRAPVTTSQPSGWALRQRSTPSPHAWQWPAARRHSRSPDCRQRLPRIGQHRLIHWAGTTRWLPRPWARTTCSPCAGWRCRSSWPNWRSRCGMRSIMAALSRHAGMRGTPRRQRPHPRARRAPHPEPIARRARRPIVAVVAGGKQGRPRSAIVAFGPERERGASAP